MLYTTKQIAEMYSGENKNVTASMITCTWNHEGLKHIKGKGKGFLYKKEWVDEFLENASILEAMNKIRPEKAILYKNGKFQKELVQNLKYARQHNKVI